MLEVLTSGELISGSWDKTIRIWNIEKCECLKRLVGHEGSITCSKMMKKEDFEFEE